MRTHHLLRAIAISSLACLARGAVAEESSLSLAGTWQFGLPREGAGMALPDKLTETIRLPGTMDDAGLGPKNEKAPALDGPYRLYNYAGPAWYRREIEVPSGWAGKPLSLFLERCRWTTTVWLDGQRIGSQDSLIAPHVYDLGTQVKPGRHQLTICVDNTAKIVLGTFVSALFGGTPGNMNGIVGRIVLQSAPRVSIDDVQVYPDVDRRKARVVVKIKNTTGLAGRGPVKIGSKTVAASWGAGGGQAEAELDMSRAKLWSEFSPSLSTVSVRLGQQTRTVRFGMRKLAAKGTQFTMNGRALFLRGTLECSIWPLKGYPPTTTPEWLRIFKIVKSHGLNHVRFHSWCPPEAAFAAADEEGVMLQVEAPQANVNVGDPIRDAFIQAEMRRIQDTYGNHPSFCLMTIGNEYGGDPETLAKHVGALIQHDPRHLYSSAAEGGRTPNRQFTVTQAGRGVEGPATTRDLAAIAASDPLPTVGHEIGQWIYYPDASTAKKYTGVMRLKNFEIVYDNLRRKNQISLAPRYVESSGKLATLLYKEEIEVLLRTRGYAGFALLDLHDYPTQGTALVGPLDEFWDSKGFVTPQEFRRYSGPVVPLLRLPKRTFTSSESLEATAQVAQFGAADMPNARPAWDIKDAQGQVVAGGNLNPGPLPTGKLSDIGTIRTPLAAIKAAGKFTVTVSLPGTEYSNSWEIWVYPASAQAPAPPPGVVLCSQWDDTARAALAEGKSVFVSTLKLPPSNALPGSFKPTFWSPVWFPGQVPNTMSILCDPKSPALARFPTEMHSNWQWWDLLTKSKSVILNDAPDGFRPLVQVVDNFSRAHMLGNLFEAQVGKGKLLFCSINLSSDLENRPAARQMLASLYAYMGSAHFRPQSTLAVEMLDRWLTPRPNYLERLGAKVVGADSEDPAHPASNILSDNEDTFWHTRWAPQADPLPHEVTIDMQRPAALKGITLLARQDGNANGRIADFEVYCSGSVTDWGQPVAKSKLANSGETQTVLFEKPATGRYLKFRALSGHWNSPFVSLSRLDIVPADS